MSCTAKDLTKASMVASGQIYVREKDTALGE